MKYLLGTTLLTLSLSIHAGQKLDSISVVDDDLETDTDVTIICVDGFKFVVVHQSGFDKDTVTQVWEPSVNGYGNPQPATCNGHKKEN